MIQAGDDVSGLVEDLGSDESHALPLDLDQPTFPPQVTAVHVLVAMALAVVLVQPAGADYPEVTSGDEPTKPIMHLVLRLDRYLGVLMQHS